MLAVDTNIVVRLLVADDERQTEQALRLFDGGAIYLSKSVIVETEWVLRRALKAPAATFVDSLAAILSLPNLTCEDEPAVQQALVWSRAGMDFADALHLASSSRAERFVTFDQDMIKAAKRLDLPVSAP